MKNAKAIFISIGLSLVLVSGWSYAGSCSTSLDCDCGLALPIVISCSISTTGQGHTVSCWNGPFDEVTCCEFDENGDPIRDIHKVCDCPEGPPGGGPPRA